jgi:hypothetical protein
MENEKGHLGQLDIMILRLPYDSQNRVYCTTIQRHAAMIKFNIERTE